MRQKLIVANWKMNFTIQEALKFFAALQREIKGAAGAEIVLCPPYTDLYAFDEALSGTNYKLGAQNMHWEEAGAFTGEISPVFLKELNVGYVLLGHSERRGYFSETDSMINKKIAAAVQQQITPIICVGETDSERSAGRSWETVESQMKRALDGQMKSGLEDLVWAYEPVWAIGTGKNATPQQAQEMIQKMRSLLTRSVEPPSGEAMRILYGGSVSEGNAGSFLKMPDVDGLLVGGASLDPEKFGAIVRAAG